MALFAAARQGRKDDAELGKGVWRRAHDRFTRGLDRYYQMLEGVEDDAVYNELVTVANELAALLPRIREVCVRAQQQLPSSGQNIPGALTTVHRALSRSGNSLAAAAEAAAMSRLESERWGIASAGLDNVRRRAELVAEDVTEAERALAAAPQL
ncbi:MULTISPECIES: hypothetical protein [unclassified Arthrobacter]|uniref:hypothetical protein n=1 Tax=unclassified Arthrobacter TaxID=235627 RepID=UPI001D13E2F1|nr:MULTISPECIES: hypothetical protein [unclassified Arthrobacter]MCC3276440.1 hypothetical protein [Arthrobacter sp. zg-Y20]MCC3280303.1 hypothetical protein [Arthrobacter sp. zg-Y40]MCC9178578.1 hypothetical protein [Arthrobacter sp. zg-Y750]MDK1316600.1 hypothetical protein [Arthrobacter sp. zg.Y20]WIB06638.1 hypothetical protein QNO06_02535 [Arthrobacter sp. zg-Y20]